MKSFKITFGTFFTVQKNYKCNEYECIFTYWKLEQMVGQNINYQKCGKTINNKCEKFLRLIVFNGCASSIVHADRLLKNQNFKLPLLLYLNHEMA